MVQDIVSGDGAKKIVIEQDSLIQEQKSLISKNDSIISLWKVKYYTCQSTIDEHIQMDVINQSTINAWKLKYIKIKKQRNAIVGFAIIAVAGVIRLSAVNND